MKHEALTITAPGISQSILMPVVIRQAKSLCRRFNLPSEPVDVYALVDTGASNTCVSKRLADRLNLEVIGDGMMDTAGGLYETNQYYIDLLMRNNVSFTDIRAMEFTSNKMFDILIGMDILTLGDFAITNANHRTVISFRVPPGTEHIDFVAEAKRNDV
jgi:predicted aspartyl protease